MCARQAVRLASGVLLLAPLASPDTTASAAMITAAPASELSVSLYRDPHRSEGALDVDELGGFALVSEMRSVSLPAGESELRFEGVADGIEASSALVTGLPAGILEKNRDARVLSPTALVRAALGRRVWRVRTDRRSGRAVRTLGTLRADNDGVVFEGPEGIEALRCSGLSETFSFSGATDLAPTPTLSVRVRSPRALEAQLTLSYLAHGFDWAANYVATLSDDGKSMDLGAWLTLANGNGVNFPDARTQVVAGRLNRDSREVEPLDIGGPILAQCWPMGTTSDIPPPVLLARAASGALEMDLVTASRNSLAMNAPMPMALAAKLVEAEQLGDLKLYRVPERTTVASRQQKQVRLLDRHAIPVDIFYRAELAADQDAGPMPAARMLRTKNDPAHHLGLALPSGLVSSFVARGGTPLLLAEAPLRDIAVKENVEFGLGASPDVQVRAVRERATVAPGAAGELPLLAGRVDVRSTQLTTYHRVEVTNARDSAIEFELRLSLQYDEELVRAAPTPDLSDGRALFRLTVPARSTATVRYESGRAGAELIRPRR